MPPVRKKDHMSPPTIQKWLEVYLVEMHRQVEEGEYPEEWGEKVIKGLKYSVKAMSMQAEEYRRGKRQSHKKAVAEILSK